MQQDRLQKPVRLSAGHCDALHPSVRLPAYDRGRTGTGIVHLGVGAFMRAHLAVYTDDALAHADGDWGIAGVSLRRPDVREALAPQDCLYTVAVADSDSTVLRLVTSIKSIQVAPEDPARIVDLIADPATRIVTLTVTEKGYGITPDGGKLDRQNAAISADLDDLSAPQSTLGFIVAGLLRRRETGAGPLTLLSCDNLPHNGKRLRAAVNEFVESAAPGLAAWLADNVTFPSTMVDRIVPATTPADIDRATAATGVLDLAHVRTEPFTQWVIEDNFAAGRPAWDAAGALFVDDVAPYETAKLRLLNGPHSALAYLGYLAGFEYVHEAMQHAAFARFLGGLMRDEISPVTPAPSGMEHGDYIPALLARFANASLNHRTWQIAMDGSQKLPQRLLNTVRDRLGAAMPVDGLCLAIAGWMRYGLGRDEVGKPIDVSDPMAAGFRAIGESAGGRAADIVAGYLGIREVFGTDLPAATRFVAGLEEQLGRLMEHGAIRAVEMYVAEHRAA